MLKYKIPQIVTLTPVFKLSLDPGYTGYPAQSRVKIKKPSIYRWLFYLVARGGIEPPFQE